MWKRVQTAAPVALTAWTVALLALGTPAAALPSASGPSEGVAEKVLRLPLRAGAPKTIDPQRGSTTYDNYACSMVYDGLLQYGFYKRPYELEPALLAEMPTRSADGRTFTFQLKQGVRFHDDPCWPGGKGREVVSKDVFYSFKRMADLSNKPKSWWLYENTIVGFDAFRAKQNAAVEAGGTFDYDAPVEGFRIIDDHNFEVVLTERVYRFIWILAMFQTSIVAREAVEFYGTKFARHPVGTGAFMLEEWNDNSMKFVRNPTYREEVFPGRESWMPGDEEIIDESAVGRRLPLVDRVEYTFYKSDNPMWLRFEEGTLAYTQVPNENFKQAFNPRTKKLESEYRRRGIVSHHIQLFDFIFRMFNMQDEFLGGDSEKKRDLRRAIILAIDFDEFNTTFYNDKSIVYDGMIPPGMDGFPETDDHRVKPYYRGPNLELAREYLAKAGYPGGEGLPAIDYYSSSDANGPQQADLMKRQLSRIGVDLNVRLLDFASLIEAIDRKQAQMFSFAWSSDYPDGENNLALFYGPNESPGSNHANYQNDEFDRLYEQIRSMAPSPERTAIYEKMRDMVLEDAVFAGSINRTRSYLVHPWLRNFKPTEQFYNWVKYLDSDDGGRQ
jgi:ABC-type transport system substrate-binding protein